jgi:N-acetylmuramoyl-L-alanine amidase
LLLDTVTQIGTASETFFDPITHKSDPPDGNCYDVRAMRNVVFLTLITVLALGASAQAQSLPSTLEFRHQGLKVHAPTLRNHVEVSPIMTLLGGESAYSASAGVWALSLGEHLVQIAPERRLVLVNGQLAKARDAPVSSPGGIAVTLSFLDDFVLGPFGFHLEAAPGGYSIVEGVSSGKPVTIRPAAADFSATTTLVLSLDHTIDASVESRTGGGVVVLMPRSAPRIESANRLRSRRVREIVAAPGRLEVDLAPGIGLISWNILANPDRVVMELGAVPPTPTPAPVIAQPVRRNGPRPIVIDPGHGGDDTGAIGASGLTEKNLTLAIANRLARILRAQGHPVRLTRNGDIGRALTDRAALANRLDARVFISLHANASTVASVKGAETYYMSLDDRASDPAAQSTADVENQAGGAGNRGNSSLDLILWDMAQSEVLNESALLALRVQARLNALLGLKDRGVKQAPFVVLTGATMPAALVEVGFLSNADERDQLASETHQQALADAIARGIGDFLAIQ